MTSDKVYTVEGYWNCPLAGCADYMGKPHFYDVLEEDSETDPETHTYSLTPLNEAVFELILKKWEIWLRWQTAYSLGETSLDTHPALPQDQEAYFLNKKAIDLYLFQHQEHAFEKNGKFNCIKIEPSINHSVYEVIWS
jgi:hypothetical protein